MKKNISAIILLLCLIPLVSGTTPALYGNYTGDIPTNITWLAYVDALGQPKINSQYDSWHQSEVLDCIAAENNFNIYCSDENQTTETSCITQGYYDFGDEAINNNTAIYSLSPTAAEFCKSAEIEVLPKNSTRGVYEYGILLDPFDTSGKKFHSCSQIEYSAEFLELRDSLSHNIFNTTNAFKKESSPTFTGPACMFNKSNIFHYFDESTLDLIAMEDSISQISEFYNYLLANDNSCNITFAAGQSPTIYSDCDSFFQNKNYETKCESLKTFSEQPSATTTFTNFNWGKFLNFNLNQGELNYYDFELSEFDSHVGEWMSDNEIITECLENPIIHNFEMYLTDYPDSIFEDNIWPVNADITFDISTSKNFNQSSLVICNATFSTKDEWISMNSSGAGVVCFDPTSKSASGHSVTSSLNAAQSSLSLVDISTNIPVGSEGNYTAISVLMSQGIKGFFTARFFPFEADEITYVNLGTNLQGTGIMPNQPVTFLLEAISFTNTDLDYYLFDSGQRKTPQGLIKGMADGSFQCSEYTSNGTLSNQCLVALKNDPNYGSPGFAVYDEPNPAVNLACGCGGTVYAGSKKDIINQKSLNTYFAYTYTSKEACGEDRICNVSLSVYDEFGKSVTKSINLFMPQVETCSGNYPNSFIGNSSADNFVGYINEGEQACVCEADHILELDDTLSATFGTNYWLCELETSGLNYTTNDTETGQDNDVWDRNRNRREKENKDLFGRDKKENEPSNLYYYIGAIFAIIIGGIIFEINKKRGNPLGNLIKNPMSKLKPTSNNALSKSPLKKFIDEAKAAGENPETIRNNLKSTGWPDSELDKYLN